MILKSCRAKDSGACISSILRDNDGRTVVRVRAGSTNSNAVQMLKALHGLWPLATTAVVENQLDGTVEAQIVVPRAGDERRAARRRAASSRFAELMRGAVLVLTVVATALYAKDVIYS